MSRKVRRAVVTACAVLSVSGCKETTRLFETASDEDDSGGEGSAIGGDAVVVARRTPVTEFYAADAEYLRKNADFFFRVWDETFSRRFDDLPVKGAVPKKDEPRPGGYYPEKSGGTDVVMSGGKSPLAKWDDAFHGGTSTARKWEREKHTSGPDWAGHCNGYSAAAQRNPAEPERDVVRAGVTFSPKDIKALMAEIYMSADYEFLGGNRCDTQGAVPLPGSRVDPTKMGDCEDINPGTFHAAVANWIGRMGHALIMDEQSRDEVWNYPVYRYEVLSSADLSETQARRAVGGSGDYIFNPNAVRFVQLRTRLDFPKALATEILKATTPADAYATHYASFTLDYVLELNAAGEILGGEWIGQSQQSHPDFVWVALEPMVGNGTRYMGNPHLDPKEVIKMWAESVGADPDNPPTGLTRPAGSDDWGRWAGFDVALDGASTGAVFAGKKIYLDIKRREPLSGANVSVELALNDKPLTSLSGAEGEALKHGFEPGLGINRLRFTWKRDGATLDDQTLRFHVMR